MTFKQVAGTAIVPTMSRLVLALAFTTAGYNKMATQSEFSSPQAELLMSLGVEVERVDVQEGVAGVAAPGVVLASFQDDGGSADPQAEEPPATEGVGEEPPPDEEATDETSGLRIPADDDEAEPASVPDPDATLDDGTYTASSMHKVTLLCHGAGWPQPRYLALVAALTELVGGVLLLVGFLTRIWGLGLSIAMGVAFYLVSMGVYQVHATSPFAFATEVGRFNTLFSQLGLFVLAFGLLLTGPGPLSIDRFLFGGGRRGAGDGDRVILDDDVGSSLSSSGGGGRPV